jgi:amino acid adenylation domain-containing protein
MKEIFEKLRELSEEKKEIFVDMINEQGISLLDITIPPLSQSTINRFPLSFTQRRLWFIEQLDPNQPVYNCSVNIRLKGEMDFEGFQKAFNKIIERHKILKANFIEIEGKPVQIIRDEYKLNIHLVDLCNLESKQQEKELIDLIQKDASYIFKLNQELLIRSTLYRLNSYEHVLCLTIHHLISDGWSTKIMMKEFAQIYDSIVFNKQMDLPDLSIQYTDYSEWQNLVCYDNTFVEQKKYWLNKLSNLKYGEIAPDKQRPKMLTHSGNRFCFEINEELTKQISSFCQEYHVTQFMFLMALMQVMLFRYTRGEDISIGTTVANRNRNEIEGLIGFFANTIAIRQELAGDSDFFTTLQNTKRGVIEGFQYQDYPFDNLVNHLKLERDLSRNPLFQVMFSLQSNLDTEVEFGKLKCEELKSSYNGTTMFDMKFEFIELNGKFNCYIDYNVDLFYLSTIEKMAINFVNILREAINNPKISLKNIKMLDKEEQDHILYASNKTEIDYPKNKTMHQLFEEQVNMTPDNIALIFGEKAMTYSELNYKSNYIAALLIANGAKNGDNIAIMTKRGFEMIIGMIAILKVGGAYVPIDPEYPVSRKEYIVKSADIELVLTCKECEEKKINDYCKKVSINASQIDNYFYDNPNIIKDSKDLAYIIYTSGSTGTPKGVMIEHHSIVNLINWVNKTFNINSKDKLLFITSMCFDLSVYDIFGMLSAGGQVVIAKEDEIKNPEKLMDIIAKKGITFWDSVPSTMGYLLSAKADSEFTQKTLKLVFLSGDWIPVNLPHNIKQTFPNAEIISLGGATEGTVWSIYYPINEVNKNWASIPYGKPIDNNYFYILDKYKNPVPYGAVGELYIGGVGVARGYSNDPEKTEASFSTDIFNPKNRGMMYKTGDMGRYLRDGNIEFLGRIDNQVKIRGFRIEIGEIESQLLKHDLIEEAVVIAKEDKDKNKYLCAYIVAKNEVEDEKIKDLLAKELPAYMIPSFVVQIEKMPLSWNGKVDIKILPEPLRKSQQAVSTDIVLNDVQKKLQKIWKEVLDVDDVCLLDNFFNLGGNSLNAVALVSKIRQEFGRSISLISFFQNPTIQGVENVLEEYHDKKDVIELIKAEKKDFYTLSTMQQWLYLAQTLEPKSVRYNIPVVFKIIGTLDISKLETTMSVIIKRHEALRTIIVDYNGEPVQKVDENVDFKINIKEIPSSKNIDEVLLLAIQPFNLEKAPLLRMSLIKTDQQENFLFFDIHHIIFDGISVDILMKEFNLIYNGAECENLKFQYKDYSEWQKNFINSSEEKTQEEYWCSQLSTKIPDLKLPLIKTGVSAKSDFDGEYFDLYVDSFMTQKINQFAKENEVTLHMLYLSVLYILLNKITGNEDILVSVPLSGRRGNGFEKIMGVFINTMPVRCKISKDMSFEEFLLEVKNICLGAYENQESPLELVLSKLSAQSYVSIRSLMDNVIFEFRENEVQNEDFQINGLKFSRYNLKKNNTHFLLDWMGINNGNDVSFRILYRKEYLEYSTVEYLVSLYIEILKSIINNPKAKIKDVELSYNSANKFTGFENELEFDF